MYWRWREFVKDQSLAMTGATHTEELDEKGLLSAMLIRFKFTADASIVDASKDRIIEWLSKIEVIANNDIVIKSATARALCGFYFYNTGKQPYEERKIKDDAVNYADVPIVFGRHERDLDYGLDLSKFDKVEVNITNEDSDTGDYFDAGTYSIYLLQAYDWGGSFKGFIRTKQIKDWTPASSSDTITEKLPTKERIRSVMLEAVPTPQNRTTDFTAEATTLLSSIKYEYKEGEIIRFDDTSEALMRENANDFGMAEIGGYIVGTNGDYIDSGLAYVVEQVACYGEAVNNPDSGATGFVGLDATRTKQKLKIVQGTTTADKTILFRAKGFGFLDCFIFKHDLAGWDNILDPAVYKPIRLKLTAGSTAGSIKINLETEATY